MEMNRLVLDSIPSDPKVHYAVDHEGTQVLQLEQSDIQVISDQSTRGSGPTWSHYEGHVLR